VTAVRAERPPTVVTPVHSCDPMRIVRAAMLELDRAGVAYEIRSTYRLAEAAARLLEQLDVEPAPVGVELAPVIPLQRRAVDR
jgi:hypothetical protein